MVAPFAIPKSASFEEFLSGLDRAESRFSSIEFSVEQEYRLLRELGPHFVLEAERTSRFVYQNGKFRVHTRETGTKGSGESFKTEELVVYDGERSTGVHRTFPEPPVGRVSERPLSHYLGVSLYRHALDLPAGLRGSEGESTLAGYLRKLNRGSDEGSRAEYKGLVEYQGNELFRVDVKYAPSPPLPPTDATERPLASWMTIYFEHTDDLWPVRCEKYSAWTREQSEHPYRVIYISKWQEVSGRRVPAEVISERHEPDGTIRWRRTITFAAFDLSPDHPIDYFRADFAPGTRVSVLDEAGRVTSDYIVGDSRKAEPTAGVKD